MNQITTVRDLIRSLLDYPLDTPVEPTSTAGWKINPPHHLPPLTIDQGPAVTPPLSPTTTPAPGEKFGLHYLPDVTARLLEDVRRCMAIDDPTLPTHESRLNVLYETATAFRRLSAFTLAAMVGGPRCTTCGHLVDNHPYRHPITRLTPPTDPKD